MAKAIAIINIQAVKIIKNKGLPVQQPVQLLFNLSKIVNLMHYCNAFLIVMVMKQQFIFLKKRD